MKLPGRFIVFFLLLAPMFASAQQAEVKFIADTLVVQAEGRYESDPDLAILAFDVLSQEKELKEAYSKASQSMQTIVGVAQRNGLAKEAIQTGVLTVTPLYEGDRKKRARAYGIYASDSLEERSERSGSGGGIFGMAKKALGPPPPPPPVQPEKITITASVQCVFGIEK